MLKAEKRTNELLQELAELKKKKYKYMGIISWLFSIPVLNDFTFKSNWERLNQSSLSDYTEVSIRL